MKLGIYRHYSGLMVLVIGVARHSDTDERFVTYVPLGVKKGPRITVRPYEAFFEEVKKDDKAVLRFEFIGEDMPEDTASDYLPLSK